METTLDRRRFLELGAAACGVLAVGALLPQAARAQVSAADLAACQAMTPEQMAETSPVAGASWDYLVETAGTIRDVDLRAKVKAILDNPAPTLAARLGDPKVRAEVHGELAAKRMLTGQTVDGLLPPTADPAKASQPFRSAPGSGYASHHAFPGGLAVHTAGNMRATLGIVDGYKATYGFALDRDTAVASQMLHDLHKPWVFAWGADGASRAEQTLAGTGEHHVLSVAESLVRGLPPEVIVAQACAHNHPGNAKDEAEVVGWLTAAAILAGVDPVGAGLLEKGGATLPLPRRMEGFVCHLGDHDYVLSVPAGKWMIAALADLARERYGLADATFKAFNQFRNFVFSRGTMMGLYEVYAVSGKDGLAAAVAAIVKPA
jgi:hypothetical protein